MKEERKKKKRGWGWGTQCGQAMEGTGEGLPAKPLHTSAVTCVLTPGKRDEESALCEHPGSSPQHGRQETPAQMSLEQLLPLAYPKNPSLFGLVLPPPPHFAKSAIIGTVWPAEIKRTANCNQPLKTPKFPTALQSLHRPREEIPFRQRKELSPSYRIIL